MATTAHARFEEQLKPSIEYLGSAEAQRSFDYDPYWPKWNSPWWHMTLLWELGAAGRIPPQALQRLMKALQTKYLQFFPLTEAEIPPGVDPISEIMCHCGLGTAYQILKAASVDVDRELPWIRKWMVQYQIADGGWNCDEAAYTKAQPKSSVVSSLPILESLLTMTNRSDKENQALDAGAEYILKRRFVRSLKSGEVINPDWLQLTFPRFYEYDLLRGLSFCVKWANQRQKPLPKQTIEEAFSIIKAKVISQNDRTGLPVERQFYKSEKTRIKDDNGVWTTTHSSDFSLLVWVSQMDQISPPLTFIWNRASGLYQPQ
jgi:hypothetical protein